MVVGIMLHGFPKVLVKMAGILQCNADVMGKGEGRLELIFLYI